MTNTISKHTLWLPNYSIQPFQTPWNTKKKSTPQTHSNNSNSKKLKREIKETKPKRRPPHSLVQPRLFQFGKTLLSFYEARFFSFIISILLFYFVYEIRIGVLTFVLCMALKKVCCYCFTFWKRKFIFFLIYYTRETRGDCFFCFQKWWKFSSFYL